MKDEIKRTNDNINIAESSDVIEVRRGDIFVSENERLRVIDVREARIMVIDLNTNKIKQESCNDFILSIESQSRTKETCEPMKYMDISQEEMRKIKAYKDIFEEILEEYYPNWELLFRKKIKKVSCDLAAQNMSITSRQFRNIFKTYLRSGRELFSLVDKRKFNQRVVVKSVVSDNPRENTEFLYRYALAEFKRTGSIQTAYDNMLRRFFREEVIENGTLKMVLIPKEKITVSYKQIRSYIEKNLGGLTIKQYKSGERNVMNNERLLSGDVKYGISRLGQRYEVDECELPCYVVNPHTGETTGKPVLYIVVDEFASIITGCYVSYDNNSCNGIRQAMLSMLEPHKNQTDKYKLSYEEDVFPSMCMPKEIRCDHGAEYESKNLEKAFAEMGIDLSLVPTGCGSLKGLVEGIHNQIQILLKNHAIDKGIVKNEYRGSDKAKGEACMTLEDIRKIVYAAILYVNQRVINDYSLDMEQLDAGLITSPCEIYKFEKNRSGDPKNVTDENRDHYMYALLAKQKDHRKFSIGRTGIKYVGYPLYFFSEESWFQNLLLDKKAKEKIEVRYDETNIGCVYVCYKGIIRKVPLSAKRESQLTYVGCDWFTFEKKYKAYKESEKLKKAKEESLNRKYQLHDIIEDVAETARVLQGPGKKYGKAPKEGKTAERQELRENPNEIINRMYSQIDNSDYSDNLDISTTEKTESTVLNTEKTIEEIPNFTSMEEQTEFLIKMLEMEE